MSPRFRLTPLFGFLFTILFAPPLFADHVSFDTCLADLRQQAEQRGISPSTLESTFSNVQQRQHVLEKDRGGQSEFIYTFWYYLQRSVTEERIKTGQAMMQTHRALLDRVHAEFGVRPQYLVALWGLETNFGTYKGDIPVFDALGTLACDHRRSRMFTRQFMDALTLVDNDLIDRHSLRGSWAGAVGHTQFMPSTYIRYALDYDANGRADLLNDLPDVFASSAYYLREMGWKEDQRWGREVVAPSHLPWSYVGLKRQRSMRDWDRLGIRQTDQKRLPRVDMKASLVAPEGFDGPTFLVYENFRAVMRWNASTYYALAVGHLADRIAGTGPLYRQPPAETFYRRADAKEIQNHLLSLGYDVGTADGILGPRTRSAIKAFQKTHQLPIDGYPSQPLLERLRNQTAIGRIDH